MLKRKTPSLDSQKVKTYYVLWTLCNIFLRSKIAQFFLDDYRKE